MKGNEFINNRFFHLFIILIIGAFIYLPFLGRQGFYRDDWYQIWAGTTQGSGTLMQMFSIDRPLHGLIYVFTHKFIGGNLIVWHLFAYITRSFTAVFLYILFSIIWSEQKIANLLISLLSLVYPGYLEQPFANTFINLYLVFCSSLVSIILSLLAFKAEEKLIRYLLLIASFLCGFFYLVAIEYLIGMEFLRFLLFYFLKDDRKKASRWQNLLNAIRKMTPFFILLTIFLIWRLLIFKSTRSSTDISQVLNVFSSDSWQTILKMISSLILSIYNVIIQAWFAPLYNLSLLLYEEEIIFLFIISSLFGYVSFSYLSTFQDNVKNKKWPLQFMLIGFLVILFLALPIIILNRKINFEKSFDRYLFHLAFGAAIFLVGLICRININQPSRNFLLSFLFTVAFFTQLANGIYYTRFWEMQRSLWWQLSWRAPGIKSDTSMVVFTPPEYRFAEAYEIWAPLNIIYSPSPGPLRLTAEVPTSQTIPWMMDQVTYGEEMRRINYTVDFKQLLVLVAPRSGVCLHVLDKSKNEISSYDDLNSRLVKPASNVDLIELHQPVKHPPIGIFGYEPDHDWCFYYQKAALARQQGNWDEIVKLGESVMALGFQPRDLSEWMPFYEGFARAHRTDLSNQVGDYLRHDANFIRAYCRPYQNTLLSGLEQTESYLINNLCAGLIG